MKKLSIILISILVAFAACTKSKEVHPEIGDGNDEIVTVGMKDVHVEYTRTDHAELQKVVFHYGLAEAQQFAAAEMTKRETFFDLTLNDLLSDTLYYYYYELFPKGGSAFLSEQKTFHTQAYDTPEPPTPPVAELPTVITTEVSEITTNSAACGGEVTNDGGAEVMERGICWGVNANPTLSDKHISAGCGLGEFTALMDSLQANMTYHVRAYAINSVGTAYGLDKEFTTLSSGSDVPEGAINGLFTINENGDQVYFAQGNLQYQASTNTWRFAEHQWDRLKEENINVSPTYDGWIDLFNWGTSGYNHGANCYQPWSTSTDPSDYYAYGIETCNLNDQTGQADWGYNPISNGGNHENLWRTLTYDEWCYILFDRETPSGVRFVKARVNDINGAILLPHYWNDSIYELNNPNEGGAYYDDNIVSAEDWLNILQEAGAVFLPNGANRIGTAIMNAENGDYWSSTRKMDEDFAYDICIQSYSIGWSTGNGEIAQSVRLVQDANK